MKTDILVLLHSSRAGGNCNIFVLIGEVCHWCGTMKLKSSPHLKSCGEELPLCV